MTDERAYELLAIRREQLLEKGGTAAKRAGPRTAAKKTAAKKTAAKKTAAKKTGAKKAAGEEGCGEEGRRIADVKRR